MTKLEFLSVLREALAGLPQSDVDERISFYTEMIDDRMEEGLSEQEAIAAIGSMDEIVAQIIADTPITKLVKQKIKPKHRLSAWEIVLLALGSPIWLSLLIAAFAVVFSLYVSLWAVVVSFWSVFASLFGSGLGGFAGGTVLLCTGNAPSGLALMAAALVCVGLSIFAFFGCKAATTGTVALTKKMALAVKKMCMRKEAAQ